MNKILKKSKIVGRGAGGGMHPSVRARRAGAQVTIGAVQRGLGGRGVKRGDRAPHYGRRLDACPLRLRLLRVL